MSTLKKTEGGALLQSSDRTSSSPSISATGAATDPTAFVDAFLQERFGLFQLKIFALAGGTGAMMAGWIMLPVFVDPMLQLRDPATFSEKRLATLGSLFFLGWALGAPLSSAVADRIGRRAVAAWALPLVLFGGCLPAVPARALSWLPLRLGGLPRYYVLHAVARTLRGFCVGVSACIYVLLMEYMPGHVRGRVTVRGAARFRPGQRPPPACKYWPRGVRWPPPVSSSAIFYPCHRLTQVALNCYWALVSMLLAALAALLHNVHALPEPTAGSSSGGGGAPPLEPEDVESWPDQAQLLQLLATAPLLLNWALLAYCVRTLCALCRPSCTPRIAGLRARASSLPYQLNVALFCSGRRRSPRATSSRSTEATRPSVSCAAPPRRAARRCRPTSSSRGAAPG
eukprot:SAG11_NODE_1318_length_5212_cov_3.462351_8_plen_399_part_00